MNFVCEYWNQNPTSRDDKKPAKSQIGNQLCLSLFIIFLPAGKADSCDLQ